MSKRPGDVIGELYENVIKRPRANDVEEARKMEQMNEELRSAFAKARAEVDEERRKHEKTLLSYPDVKPPRIMDLQPQPKTNPLTVEEARKYEEMNKSLRKAFEEARTKELMEREEREQRYEPITRAIKEQKLNDFDERQKKIQANRDSVRLKRSNVIFRPRAMSTPGKDHRDVPLPDDMDDTAADESIQEYVEQRRRELGPIAKKYLPEARDGTFGIWYDLGDQTLKIGHSPITLKMDSIILKKVNKAYKGTEGLWKLLTSPANVDKEYFTNKDLDNYKDILIRTDALYQNNDVASGRPKSSSGQKWRKIVKNIWDEHKLEQMDAETGGGSEAAGSGLKEYAEDVEYKYIDNMRDLIERLMYIEAQETAGNNNFLGEKRAVVEFIKHQLEHLITKPNSLKYVIRCLSALPEGTVSGSGLLNDLINSLPFELHAPGYNFMGPGTKLEERLKRGDRGINPLDEAARAHDIWYSKHKKAEDRWEADKVFQDKAFERVIAPDADLPERLWGLTAGSTMWAKRKLGLGLSRPTSGYIYPLEY